MNKLFVLACVVLAVVYAEDEKKDAAERPKTFKRLIPADVLRGKQNYFLFKVNGIQGFRKVIIFISIKQFTINQ